MVVSHAIRSLFLCLGYSLQCTVTTQTTSPMRWRVSLSTWLVHGGTKQSDWVCHAWYSSAMMSVSQLQLNMWRPSASQISQVEKSTVLRTAAQTDSTSTRMAHPDARASPLWACLGRPPCAPRTAPLVLLANLSGTQRWPAAFPQCTGHWGERRGVVVPAVCAVGGGPGVDGRRCLYATCWGICKGNSGNREPGPEEDF